MSSAHTRTQARRNTLLAQGAALLLAAVAVAAIVVGIPGVRAPSAQMRTVSDRLAELEAERARLESAEVVEEGAPSRAVDLQAIAQRLEIIHQVARAEPEPVDTTIPEQTNTGGENKVEVKYLGNIAEPDRQLALVSLNGHQRIIPMGATISFTPEGGEAVSLRVVGVSAGELVYELDGEASRIDKAPRLASAVTKIEANPAQTLAGPGVEPPQASEAQGEESDMDRRRREAMERRQRILEERERRGGGRPDDGEN
jgi:hypothetical protein